MPNTKNTSSSASSLLDPMSAIVQGGTQAFQSVTDTIGTILNYMELQKAQKEAKEQSAKQDVIAAEKNRFYEQQTKEQAAEAKRTSRFNEAQTRAGNVMGITRDAINQVTNFLNSNVALRNNVLKSWGA